jgi:hypothetical protein
MIRVTQLQLNLDKCGGEAFLVQSVQKPLIFVARAPTQVHLELVNRQQFSTHLQQHQSTSDIDDISIIMSAFPSSIHRH